MLILANRVVRLAQIQTDCIHVTCHMERGPTPLLFDGPTVTVTSGPGPRPAPVIMAGVNSPAAAPGADLVQARWRAREAPYGDFVLFSDGSLSVMKLIRFSPADRLHDPRAEHWQWWEVLRATAWTPTDWMDVDTTFASSTCAGSRALAGESSDHGSIGWVALTRDDDQQTLEWLAVSCSSNPFAEVALDGATVTATSTSGRVWTFPRSAPQQVRIDAQDSAPS